jgi:hypothetical protein
MFEKKEGQWGRKFALGRFIGQGTTICRNHSYVGSGHRKAIKTLMWILKRCAASSTFYSYFPMYPHTIPTKLWRTVGISLPWGGTSWGRKKGLSPRTLREVNLWGLVDPWLQHLSEEAETWVCSWLGLTCWGSPQASLELPWAEVWGKESVSAQPQFHFLPQTQRVII